MCVAGARVWSACRVGQICRGSRPICVAHRAGERFGGGPGIASFAITRWSRRPRLPVATMDMATSRKPNEKIARARPSGPQVREASRNSSRTSRRTRFSLGDVDTSWRGSVLRRDLADVKQLWEEDDPLDAHRLLVSAGDPLNLEGVLTATARTRPRAAAGSRRLEGSVARWCGDRSRTRDSRLTSAPLEGPAARHRALRESFAAGRRRPRVFAEKHRLRHPAHERHPFSGPGR